MKKETIVTSLRFPLGTYEKIKKIARKEHRGISQQIVHLCENAMEEEKQKASA